MNHFSFSKSSRTKKSKDDFFPEPFSTEKINFFVKAAFRKRNSEDFGVDLSCKQRWGEKDARCGEKLMGAVDGHRAI